MTYEQAVWQDPERMSGALCFRNDRIPVKTLFDYLAAGDAEGFFEDYPDVPREAVEAIVRESYRRLEPPLDRAA